MEHQSIHMAPDTSVSPRVSVFIASYNHARFLPECLDSILAQTFQDLEVVVVDDGSKDDSLAVLEDYQRRFPGRVSVHTHPGHANKGISATSNLAISRSRGEFLAWTGSDDVWYPDKLEQQVAQLQAHPEYGMVYSYAQFIDADSRLIDGLYGVDITADPNPVGRMIQSCHPPAMTAVFRRQCLERVGLFDETLVYSDWDLFTRIFAHWPVGFIARPLAKYRIHTANVSKKINPQLDLQRILDFTLKLQAKSGAVKGALASPRNLAWLELQLTFLVFCLGRQGEAQRHLETAFGHDPSLLQDVACLNDWLNSWKPDFYTPAHPNFSLWFLARLPAGFDAAGRGRLVALQLEQEANRAFFVQRGVQKGMTEPLNWDMAGIFADWPGNITRPEVWQRQVLSQVYAGCLFASHDRRDRPRTRHFWLKSVLADPGWLRNRGVWSIGLHSCLGRPSQAAS